MANYDWNWWFGPHSILGRLLGVHSKPTPTPTPVPTPTPTPTPVPVNGDITVTVSVSPAVTSASLTPDTNPAIVGTVSGSSVSFVVPANRRGWGAQLAVSAVGYVDYSQRITLPLTSGPLDAVSLTAKPVVKKSWNRAQLMDLQGDLMLWMPELPLSACPETGILSVADNGGTPRGILNGWIWTVWIPWYSAEHRQQIYAKILSYKWTHCPLQVCNPGVNGGYHGLRPTTQADCDAYGALVSTVHDEMIAAGIIPLCAGVAPGPAASGGAALASGFDGRKALVAMSDWDNTTWAAERVKCLADNFPNALLYYERPGDPNRASGIDKSPNNPVDASWDISNGGLWIAALQRLCPNFVGMMYEVNNPDGLDKCTAELQKANAFWRDVQQVRFEIDTYWKFWENLDKASADKFNDDLQARNSQLKGFFSGGTMHTPPGDVVANTVTGGAATDMIPVDQITFVSGPNIGAWPLTTKITKLNINVDGVECEFDKRDGPSRWTDTPDLEKSGGMGPLEYSLGIVLNIGGKWYANAPIETWNGRNNIGGPIQSQDIGDGTGRGQIAGNWFYNSRWAPMNGYQPKPGEMIGLFVASGDCRNNVCPVQERSNIVLVPLPAPGQVASYSYSV